MTDPTAAPVLATTAPATRDIAEVTEAITVVRDELRFHVERLKQNTTPDPEMQRKLRHLILDYLRAETTLARLYGYQMRRLARRDATGTTAPVADTTIDAAGVAAAHVEETDHAD